MDNNKELKAWRDKDNGDIVIAYDPMDASVVWNAETNDPHFSISPDVWVEEDVSTMIGLIEEEGRKRHVRRKTIKEWIKEKGRSVLCVDTGEV